MAKTIIILGCIMVLLGLGMLFINKLPFLGKLPGDIVWKKGNFTLIFPLTTSILISVILTLVLNLLFRR
ncbi:MAG: DUF2905 domain-containing protein [Zhaonellaceae bacterium]